MTLRRLFLALALASATLAHSVPPAAAQVAVQDLQIGVDLLLAGDAASAAEVLIPVAERGDPDARYLLATDAQLQKAPAMAAWRRTQGGQEAAEQQLQAWLGTAADAGHRGALEAMVTRGKDLATRMHYAERGADADLAGAMEWLGSVRFGVYDADEVRAEEGLAWLQLAAERGRAASAINLGVRYLRGNGLPQDKERGVRWLLRASDMGDPSALMPLANAASEDPGLVGGREEALRWLLTAKENAGGAVDGMEQRLRDSLDRDAEARAEGDARIWWERKRDDPSTPIGRTARWLETRYDADREWANWEVAFLASNVDCPAPKLQRLDIANYESSGHFDACMTEALEAYGVR